MYTRSEKYWSEKYKQKVKNTQKTTIKTNTKIYLNKTNKKRKYT